MIVTNIPTNVCSIRIKNSSAVQSGDFNAISKCLENAACLFVA